MNCRFWSRYVRSAEWNGISPLTREDGLQWQGHCSGTPGTIQPGPRDPGQVNSKAALPVPHPRVPGGWNELCDRFKSGNSQGLYNTQESIYRCNYLKIICNNLSVISKLTKEWTYRSCSHMSYSSPVSCSLYWCSGYRTVCLINLDLKKKMWKSSIFLKNVP